MIAVLAQVNEHGLNIHVILEQLHELRIERLCQKSVGDRIHVAHEVVQVQIQGHVEQFIRIRLFIPIFSDVFVPAFVEAVVVLIEVG